MIKLFFDDAWEDVKFWVANDRKVLKKIFELLQDIERNGNNGIGQPEPLRGNLSGYWSRRITVKDRLIYRLDAETESIEVIRCKGHYDSFT